MEATRRLIKLEGVTIEENASTRAQLGIAARETTRSEVDERRPLNRARIEA